MIFPPLRILALGLVVVTGLPATASAQAPSPPPTSAERQKVTQVAASWAAELARLCPVAKPGDQAAFDACRARVFKNTTLERGMAPRLVWGRQPDPKAALRDSNLTLFAPDVWLGTYLPLFMFNGKHTVEYVDSEKLFRVRLEAAFRGRLTPGQYPYPFWHNKEKWSAYQGARALLLWIDPHTAIVRSAQYTPVGKSPPLIATTPTEHQFDGKWMWTDANGKLQPHVTLFDGLYSDRNPHKPKLEAAYRDLALQMRAGHCSACHVPNNPSRMKRLVLLQTPAHAAGEIKRILSTVRSNRMPLDDLGVERPLEPTVRKALLDSGARFEKVVDAANRWEAKNHPRDGKSR